MSSGISGWVIVGLLAVIVILIGGVALPVIVPMMIGYTQGSQSVIASGNPFFQFMADWWPVALPAVILVGLITLVMSGRSSGGGGSV